MTLSTVHWAIGSAVPTAQRTENTDLLARVQYPARWQAIICLGAGKKSVTR